MIDLTDKTNESARAVADLARVRRRKNSVAERGCWARNCFEAIEVNEVHNIAVLHNGQSEFFHLECFGVVFGINDFDAPGFSTS